MNKKQLIVVWVTAILVIGIIMFTPRMILIRGMLISTNRYASYPANFSRLINWSLVISWSLPVLILGGLLIYFLRKDWIYNFPCTKKIIKKIVLWSGVGLLVVIVAIIMAVVVDGYKRSARKPSILSPEASEELNRIWKSINEDGEKK